MSDTARTATEALIRAGQLFHARGWVPSTGGNFSARLAPERVLITASGCHKGELTEGDFLVTDLAGRVEDDRGRRTSYETGLHLQVYRARPSVGCVLHVHSVTNTVLSRQRGDVTLAGYELLKVFPGVTTHDTTLRVPVFDNDQDIARLAAQVDTFMKTHLMLAAYLIRGHGLYAWGADIAEARHRVEALEFMFECEMKS